jgi:hypothetical protein
MSLHPLDLGIVLLYLAAMAGIGFWVRANATKKLDSLLSRRPEHTLVDAGRAALTTSSHARSVSP